MRTGALVLVAVLLTSGLFVGCQSPEDGTLSADEKAAIADTIRSFVREGNARWENLEPEPFLELISDTVQFFWRGAHYGPAEYEKTVRTMMPAYEQYAIDEGGIYIDVLGRNAAVASFTYEATIVDTTGKSRTSQAAFTSVLQRQGGDWKVVQMHESFVAPGQSE